MARAGGGFGTNLEGSVEGPQGVGGLDFQCAGGLAGGQLGEFGKDALYMLWYDKLHLHGKFSHCGFAAEGEGDGEFAIRRDFK